MGYRPDPVTAAISIFEADSYSKSLPATRVPLPPGQDTDATLSSILLDVPASTLLGACRISIDGNDIGTATLVYAQLDVVSADGTNQLMAFTVSTPTLLRGNNNIDFDDPGSGATVGSDLSMTGDGLHFTSAAGGRYFYNLFVAITYDR